MKHDFLRVIPANWHDSIWHLYWHSIWHIFCHALKHIFWHVVLHSLWHSMWHSIWHSTSQICWHSIWHFWTFCLTLYLTFFLALELAFKLTYYLRLHLTFYLSIYLTYILTFYLVSILACYCIVFGFPRSSLLMILRNWNDTVTACGRSTICFQRIRSNGQQREKGTTSKLQLECLQKLTHHCVKLAFASDFADLAWASSIYGKYGSKSVELSSKSWIIQLNLLDLLHNFCNMGNRRFNLLQLFLSTYCSYLYLILGARFS